MSHSIELPIPPAAASAERAFEIARVWAANGKQHISLATKIWPDPATWGIMLSDLAGHIANAYAQSEGLDRGSVLNRIKTALDLEWEAPTDNPLGGLMQ